MRLKKCWVLACLAMAAPAVSAAGQAEATAIKYFRSDAGIASRSAGPLPDHFDAPGVLQWRAPVDAGHSTPVLVEGKIILTTYRATEQELATVALDQQTGQVLWKRVASTGHVETFHRVSGSPAASTPAFDGQKLYVFFGGPGLICYDLNGTKVWDHPMGPFQDEYGAGSSPILLEDKVILQEDHDLNSFLIALDRVHWQGALENCAA